jgi:DNA-binding transcriptional ArsR family regulator
MAAPEADAADSARHARILAHPLRHRLLLEYAQAVTSPSKLAAALGERVNVVSYHTGVLAKAGYLELVRTEPHRGATEHYYRARGFGEISDRDWERLPSRLRRTLVRRSLELVWRDASAALPAGGMDAATAHVSRALLTLDEPAREQLAALLRSTLERAGSIGDASRARDASGARSELVILYFTRA